MSNARWRIDKQLQQLGSGKSATRRVKAYVDLWESRCYKNGLPEELPHLLYKSNRAPCWKALAVAILRNDLKFRSLGFTEATYNKALIAEIEGKRSKQLPLPFGQLIA